MDNRAASASDPRPAIVAAMRAMDEQGLVRGTAGNVSVRCDGGFWITPSGVPAAQLTPDRIVRVRWDGSAFGAMRPSSEWPLHRDVLMARAEFGAVVHTHSPHATAVAILGRDIPAVHYMVAAAGGADIRCARYATFGSDELGMATVIALQGRRACLLAHHGVVAAHADLDRALALAGTVEEMAQLYLQVLPHGARVLPPDEMERVVEKFKTYGQPGKP